jgi:hypothetical protein
MIIYGYNTTFTEYFFFDEAGNLLENFYFDNKERVWDNSGLYPLYLADDLEEYDGVSKDLLQDLDRCSEKGEVALTDLPKVVINKMDVRLLFKMKQVMKNDRTTEK